MAKDDIIREVLEDIAKIHQRPVAYVKNNFRSVKRYEMFTTLSTTFLRKFSFIY